MALLPMEHDGAFETVDNIITSTDRSSGVTMAINKLFMNKERGIGILYIQFMSSTASTSNSPIHLGRLQSAYTSNIYGNRPITPLINDTSVLPEGCIYVNKDISVNVYNTKANVYYIAYIPILLTN